MNGEAIREMLRDTWFRAFAVALPVALLLQFMPGRPVVDVAISVTFLVVAGALTMRASYHRSVTRVEARRDAVAVAAIERDLTAFLADRRK